MSSRAPTRGPNRPLLAALFGLLGLLSSPRSSHACDHTLALTDTVVDRSKLGAAPGDVVCITAGKRPFLRLNNFVGSEDGPIVVVNCGGLVDIENDDRGYGLTVDSSSYFQISGTGDPELEYGIRVRARAIMPYRASGVAVGGLEGRGRTV